MNMPDLEPIGTIPTYEIPIKVYQKMAQVMRELGPIEKDGTHPQKYKYQTAEAVMTAIRLSMDNVGLILVPAIVSAELVTPGGNDAVVRPRWSIHYRYTFVCIESGQTLTTEWHSEALATMDTSNGVKQDDKAMGKASTYALKYFLLRTFLVSSEDDEDLDKTDPQPVARGDAKPKTPLKPREQKPASSAAPKSEVVAMASANQQTAIKATFTEIYGSKEAQAMWHTVIETLTGGKTQSTKEITDSLAKQILEAAVAEALGRKVYGDQWDSEYRVAGARKYSNDKTGYIWELTVDQSKELAASLAKQLRNQKADDTAQGEGNAEPEAEAVTPF